MKDEEEEAKEAEEEQEEEEWSYEGLGALWGRLRGHLREVHSGCILGRVKMQIQ